MCEVQCDTLAELRLVYKEDSQKVYSVCSRVFIYTKENKTKPTLELHNECSASEDELNKSSEQTAQSVAFESGDTKQEVDSVSCYCSASHTDNISTDEHDSLRDSHISHSVFKGLHSSDSGTDLTESKHDYDSAWQKYWSSHGETIIWKSWIAKYSAYINPEYLEYGGNGSSDSRQGAQTKSLRFSFEEKDLDQASLEHEKKEDLALKNRMLVRNLSGSDSYDKLQTDISEGWNPLSPASVECETEAERLLSSRCSRRTLDSMTNVTRISVSSIELSQSTKSSDSFSSVSSVQSSLSSSSSEEVEDNDYEQQWNQLWKTHYEEEYLKSYNKFMVLHDQEGLEEKLDALTMMENVEESVKQKGESSVEDPLPEAEMVAMGLPVAFGSRKSEGEVLRKEGQRKRNLEDTDKAEESSLSKMKAGFNLIGIEYQDEKKPKFVGTVEYKKKNIRFQNRQLKIHKDAGKQPKHLHFDEDGNLILQPETLPSSGSSDLKDTCSSNEEEVDLNKASTSIIASDGEKVDSVLLKRKRRKKKHALLTEIKDNPYLKRYWRKRFSLFSRFDQGVQLDEESWFSVTPEAVAKHHASRFKKYDVIVDAFCGVGGNTIQFACAGLQVIAVDIDPQKLSRAHHNAMVYGVASKIDFILGDFMQLSQCIKADAVFLSPPWGGPSYLKQKVYELDEALQPVPFTQLMNCAKKISNNIGVFLPRNSNTHTLFVAGLGGKIEIEQDFLNNKLIALTAYYNDLISIQ